MSYKYSKGYQIIGDLSGSDDANRNTGIDFEEDYIGFEASGSTVMVISGSAVGIGTTTPDYTLDVAGNIGVDQYIYHNGDADTWIRFSDDDITVKAGGKAFLTLEEKSSAPHELTINDGSNNIDFIVKGNGSGEGNPAFKVDASANRVGINGVGSPDEALHVDGNIKLQGDDPRIKINGDTDSHPGLELYENGTRKWIVYNDYTNDNLAFKTNSAVRMSIEQAGNVGIGTASPDQLLHIQDGNLVLQHNNNNEFSTELQFTKSRNATDGSHTVVQSGDILGEIVFKGSDGDEFVNAAAITAKVGFSSPGNNDMPGKIVFSTTQDGAVSLTEAMRIDEGQNVVLENGAIIVKSAAAGVTIGEGTNSWQGAAFDSYSAAYNSKRGARIVSRGDTGTTNRGTFVLRLEQHDAGSGLEAIQVDANGNVKVTGGSVGSVSDSRVKENISTLGTVLDKVKLLNPVEFDWADPIQNTDPDRTSNHDFGFIAQEVELIYPDAIYTGPETNDDMPDNLKTMSYTSLIPILTKAIQEQQEQIDELKAQVAALQN